MVSAAELSDEELMDLLRRRQAAALEVLYDRHHRLALALAYRVVGDRETAEDVIQDAFLAAWHYAASYRPELGKARAWLLTIVRHRAIDRVRRRRLEDHSSELSESIVDQWSPALEHIAELRFERHRILQALAALSAEQRHVIELAYFGGLTHSEIAERTALPLGTVKGRIRLAMEKLRLLLADLSSEGASR